MTMMKMMMSQTWARPLLKSVNQPSVITTSKHLLSYPLATALASEHDGLLLSNNKRRDYHIQTPSLLQQINTNLQQQQQGLHRNFSTADGSAPSNLSSILTREIDDEVASGSLMEPDILADVKSGVEANWRIVDGRGDNTTATTRLYKRQPAQNGAKIMVEFHCQDSEATEDEEEEGVVETEDGEELSPTVKFTVTVSKAGKSLVFSCLTEETDFVIEGIVVRDAEGASEGEGSLDEKAYQGPVFTELEEDLQDAFGAYLQEECEISDEVVSFVAMFSDYKEQAEYVNWMKSVRDMVQ